MWQQRAITLVPSNVDRAIALAHVMSKRFVLMHLVWIVCHATFFVPITARMASPSASGQYARYIW